jgi:hypothetical protein
MYTRFKVRTVFRALRGLHIFGISEVQNVPQKGGRNEKKYPILKSLMFSMEYQNKIIPIILELPGAGISSV